MSTILTTQEKGMIEVINFSMWVENHTRIKLNDYQLRQVKIIFMSKNRIIKLPLVRAMGTSTLLILLAAYYKTVSNKTCAIVTSHNKEHSKRSEISQIVYSLELHKSVNTDNIVVAIDKNADYYFCGSQYHALLLDEVEPRREFYAYTDRILSYSNR